MFTHAVYVLVKLALITFRVRSLLAGRPFPTVPAFRFNQILHKRFFQIRRILPCRQFGGRTYSQHAAFVHKGNAVAAGGFVHKVGRNENGDFVFAGEFQKMPPEHIAGGGIDPRSRFVQNQYFGMVQTGGGQLQALADAQRQRCGCGVGNVRQIKLLQGFFHRRRAFSAHLVESGVQIQIAAHAQFFIQRKRLRHIADTHFRIQAARVYRLAQQRGGAFGRLQQTSQHFHGGGLAAAVAAEKAENLAFLNGKADMIHSSKIAETLGQPVRFHRGRRSGIGDERRNVQTARTLLFFRRQHFDVGLFQHVRAVIRQHVGSRLVFQQPARVHRQQPLETLRFFNIGGRHNHGHTRVFPPQIVHQRPKLAARQRVHARGRFVQNQQIRAVHQCAAQTQLLLHPAR